MVKNERGGVGIKTLADGYRASVSDRWDRSSTPTHPERSSLSVECLLASHRMSPAHSAQPRAALGRTLALAGPHLWPQSYPSPKGGQGERKSCKSSKGTIQPEVGRKDLMLALGVSESASHSHTLTLTHTHVLPLAVLGPLHICSAHTCSLTARTVGPF